MEIKKTNPLPTDAIIPIVPGLDFDRRGAAKYIAEQTGHMTYENLGNHAVAGTGPVMRFVGKKAYYRKSDLDDWICSYVGAPSKFGRKYLRNAAK
jgi:hypothetical protein